MTAKKTHAKQDALEASTKYFKGDSFAAGIWTDKYALRNESHEFLELTPDDMHRRMAREYARAEAKYPNPMSEEQIFGLIGGFKYVIPGGSVMFGMGNHFQLVSLGNCFVISVVDSIGGIHRADERISQISKRRGGCGIDISPIRPKGLPTKNAALSTDGILVFMDEFSTTCRRIAQSGRRGALMISISVHHPEIMNFIKSKAELSKVTGANISVRVTDEFMRAVKADKEYELRWPVDSDKPSMSAKVRAKDVWDELISHAYAHAEPGILFWDTITKNSPSDCYGMDWKTTSTNPCLTGDAMVYVADGRGCVPIKKLAEAGEDVKVFCYDKDNNVVVRTMRNPRLTGIKQPIYKITFDDGSSLRTTGNHGLMTTNSLYTETLSLKSGTGVKTITRYVGHMPSKKSGSLYYWVANGVRCNFAEHRIIAEGEIGRKLKRDETVHHRNFDGLDNSPSNREILSVSDHSDIHRVRMLGDNNPMRRAAKDWSPSQWESYSNNMSKAVSQDLNGRFSGFSSEQIRQHALDLTQSLGRRFSKRDWQPYAKSKGLPVEFSQWRRQELGTLLELSMWSAKKLGIATVDLPIRTTKTLLKAQAQGYRAEIVCGKVMVDRVCEWCGDTFQIEYTKRERAFCVHQCALDASNALQQKRREESFEERTNQRKEMQAEAYSNLKFSLNREPSEQEWVSYCKSHSVLCDVRRAKYGFHSFAAVQKGHETYNHKVVSVELDGYEDVYNGTVDDFHNFFSCINVSHTKDNQNKWTFVNNKNCGELPLPPAGSCLLTSLNLSSYVMAPFTPEAKFDEEKFASHVRMAQRMLDDLVDLEIEHVDAILKKIERDPEDEATKANEAAMWKEVRVKCELGRRTGLGVTALGDCIAMLNAKYGDDRSHDIVKRIYSTLRNEAYRSSVEMAKERGGFPIFDHRKEKDHPYLSKLPKDIQDEMAKHGRRNIACLTTAPVGTASNVAALLDTFGTTSGFEPVFLHQYTRKRKMSDDDTSEPDFVDEMGDKWKKFDIFHPGVQSFINMTGKTFEESPYNGAQASEIDFKRRVELQALATRYVDHSVSSTVNLPNDISEEAVGQIYMSAWEAGCKGLTVYRQGSRDGVLVEKGKGDKQKQFEPTRECDNCDEVNDKFRQLLDKGQRPGRIMVSSAPKRPETMECDIVRAKVGKDEWVFIIGKLHGRPYEIFGGDSGDLTLPKKHKSGWVIKDGKLADRSLYDLVVGDLNNEDEKMVVRNISKAFNNYQHAPFSRVISLCLRHGVPIRWICEQITKDPEDDFFSFNRALARVLKRYVADGESSGMDCPDCHNQMVYKGGCPTCMVCGKSSCA